MNHHYLEEHNIVDRYLLGKLPAEEQARFEEHFFDCQECLERLETTQDFRRALKSMAAEEAARSRIYAQAGLLAWVARLSRGRRMALLLGAILLLVSLPAALLVMERGRVRQELAHARMASEEWQRQYGEKQQAAQGLKKELQAAEQKLLEQRQDLESQLERERQARTRAVEEMNRLTRPQAQAPIFVLSTVRGGAAGESASVNQIRLPRSPQWIILSLELEPDPEIHSYRATLSTAAQRVIWRERQLKPNSRDGLGLSFHSQIFQAGDYLLTLEGLTSEGHSVPVARYPFRVSNK